MSRLRHRLARVRAARWRILALLCAALASFGRPARALEPLVGAYRWDNWFAESPHAAVLDDAPAERKPFFDMPSGAARLRLGGGANAVDAENAYAFSAGVDYWIFGYYTDTGSYNRDPVAMSRLNRALDNFRRLENRRGMRFAIQINQSSPFEDIGPLSERLARFASDRDYLRMEDGAAPVFVYQIGQWEKSLGGPGNAKRFFVELQQRAARLAGVAIRFILVGGSVQNALAYVAPEGPFFLFASYVNAPGFSGKAHSFGECADIGRRLWRAAAAASLPFMPTVTLGWDYRPLLSHSNQLFGRPTTPDWCEKASDDEWRKVIGEALAVSRRSSAGALMTGVLIYAWNELTEGGWLVPTRVEGVHRLRALADALNKHRRVEKIDLRFPNSSPYRWPCPLGRRAARDRETQPSDAERAIYAGSWISRSCR